MGVPLEEKPHRSWQNFLPAFEPNGLRPGYTLGEMRGWLSKQKSLSYPVTTRDFLLQAPRGAMKSSAGHIFLAQAELFAFVGLLGNYEVQQQVCQTVPRSIRIRLRPNLRKISLFLS